MISGLKLNQVYMWIFPAERYGSKFKVTKILEKSYLIEYLNHLYGGPRVDQVEISFGFIDRNLINIVRLF